MALAATIGAAVAVGATLAVTGTDSSNPISAPTTASINTQDPYDVAVDAPTALPQRPAFDTPIQRLIDANQATTMHLGPTDRDGFSRWFAGS